MKRTVFVLVLAVLVGCSADTPGAGPTGQPSTSVSPSPTPTRKVPAKLARAAAVIIDGSLNTYDVKTDMVIAVATGVGIRLPRWVSKTQISFVQDATGTGATLRTVDTKSRVIGDTFSDARGIDIYGWSPDRESIAYIATDSFGYPHLIFRSVNGSGVLQTVATLARASGRATRASDQTKIEYSADGAYVLVVYTPADGDGKHPVPDDQSQLQVFTADGVPAFSVPQVTDPTMAAWSTDGKRVFFRTKGGLREWRVGAQQSASVPGGVPWYDPSIATNGAYAAFDTGATSAGVKVRALDLKTGVRTDITRGGFFHPLVADPNTVWVQRVTPCSPGCPSPVVAAPEVFAYDRKTGKPRKLALRSLIDIDVRFE